MEQEDKGVKRNICKIRSFSNTLSVKTAQVDILKRFILNGRGHKYIINLQGTKCYQLLDIIPTTV